MKAVTLHQPWASLIAVGAKTIETRGRAMSYRGRIAIHAAKREADLPLQTVQALTRTVGFDGYLADFAMPVLGAVVASAVVEDCVPIVEDRCADDIAHVCRIGGALIHHSPLTEPFPDGETEHDVSAEYPFGHYEAGRFAILLGDVARVEDRCPWCWGAIPPPPIAWIERADSALTARNEVRVVAERYECPVCSGAGSCAPIPARGQQAVPWEWTAPLSSTQNPKADE